MSCSNSTSHAHASAESGDRLRPGKAGYKVLNSGRNPNVQSDSVWRIDRIRNSSTFKYPIRNICKLTNLE